MNQIKRTSLVLAFMLGALLILSCGLLGPLKSRSEPEDIAKASFEKFAKEDLPGAYRNASFEVLERDDTFARVRIRFDYREAIDAEWKEYEGEIQVVKRGNEWVAPKTMEFHPVNKPLDITPVP